MFDITTLAGKQIILTDAHIEESVKNSVRHHPIALALNDVTDKSVIAHIGLFGKKFAFHSVSNGKKIAELTTTKELEAWIWDYQQDKPIAACVLYVFKQNGSLWIGLENPPQSQQVWMTETFVSEGVCHDQSEPQLLNVDALNSAGVYVQLHKMSQVQPHLCVNLEGINAWIQQAITEYPEVTTCLTIAKRLQDDGVVDIDLHYGAAADAAFSAQTIASAMLEG